MRRGPNEREGNVRSPLGLLNLVLSPYVSPVLWAEDSRPEREGIIFCILGGGVLYRKFLHLGAK